MPDLMTVFFAVVVGYAWYILQINSDWRSIGATPILTRILDFAGIATTYEPRITIGAVEKGIISTLFNAVLIVVTFLKVCSTIGWEEKLHGSELHVKIVLRLLAAFTKRVHGA